MTQEDESALPEDPWLTLAEIAQELRVNPATVRLWVSRGRLQATRAGQRKLLVRRSELDRMLREVNAPGPRPAESQVDASVHGQDSARRALAASRPVAPAPSTRLAAGDIGEAVQAMRSADEQWEAALDASANPPPDPGFAARVRALAAGCDAEVAAFEKAIAAKLGWRPLDEAPETFVLSYELRPGAVRPGPPGLWDEFDTHVRQLADAMCGADIRVVRDAFAALGATLHEIADALTSAGAATGRSVG